MKCEIVRDLLPMYIEDLCSCESKKEVEAHLKDCQECQEKYQQLRQEYAISNTGDEEKEHILEEKDLLEKSKKAIKNSFADKIISRFFCVVLSLGLIINIFMITAVIVGYHCKYPKLYFGGNSFPASILILIFPFLPTLLSITGRIVMAKSKKSRLLSRILFIGTIPSIIFGAICTLAFLIIPPICSATGNPAHYLVLDKGMETAERVIEGFYPDRIPEDAAKIKYRYVKYSALFSDELNLEASWVLPASEYDTAKKNVLAQRQFQDSSISQKGENHIVSQTNNPGGVTLSFEYNDSEKRVTYHASVAVNR